MIDDVRLYSSALDAAAIAELAAAVRTGPIAHWMLDEGTGTTAVDSVGGNDATLNNGPTWAAGALGGAIEFDGLDDRVTTNAAFTPPPVGTVTFWMQVSGAPDGRGRILGMADNWEIRHESTGSPDVAPSALALDLGVSGTNQGFASTTLIDEPGRWYHVAAAYDTTTEAFAVYIDGVLEASGTYPSDLEVPAPGVLSIGARTGSSENFDGVLDDVRIYDTMLAPAEIAALAAAGGGGGGGGGGTFRDEFNTAGSYAGDDGTLSWATDWLEINEADGPGAGDEIVASAPVSGYLVQVQDNDGGGEGIQREADLTGRSTATLTFIYWRTGLDDVNDYVTVDVSNDGGSTWVELERFVGPASDAQDNPQSASYDISAYIAPNTRIRFLSSPNLAGNERVRLDDIQIEVD
jgi:hypothetical protein